MPCYQLVNILKSLICNPIYTIICSSIAILHMRSLFFSCCPGISKKETPPKYNLLMIFVLTLVRWKQVPWKKGLETPELELT